MTSVQSLIEKKALLEKELAETLKQAQAKKRELEAQIERERRAQIQAGVPEIRKIVQTYHLTPQDLVGVLDAQGPHRASKSMDGDGVMLSEIRRYYNSL
jgi:DNA-binding protein H-NS